MFEAAELGRKVSKHEFDEREPELHAGLLAVQRRLREADLPVVIIVSGVEGAGKGGVVSVIHKWMDARGIETHAFWDETDEERLSEDGVTVDNTRRADSTYVSVRIDDRVSSAISLYPIGNAFTGTGLIVKNGVLTKGIDPATGSSIKTWEFDVVRQKDRKKLHKDQLQALMYTLALVCSPSSFGRSHAFTSR